MADEAASTTKLGESIVGLLRDRLNADGGAEASQIVDAIIHDAKVGDHNARKLVLLYIEGKPRENRGEPVDVTVRIVDDVG